MENNITIEHIALWVNDLEKMKTFYEKYFNAQAGVLYHNPAKHFSSYFLSFSEGCRLELMYCPNIEYHTKSLLQEFMGFAHFAVSVGSKTKVEQLTDILEQAGCQIVGKPRTTGDGYYESVVLDPEGNRIEITI